MPALFISTSTAGSVDGGREVGHLAGVGHVHHVGGDAAAAQAADLLGGLEKPLLVHVAHDEVGAAAREGERRLAADAAAAARHQGGLPAEVGYVHGALLIRSCPRRREPRPFRAARS
jgi:hypothetical protein